MLSLVSQREGRRIIIGIGSDLANIDRIGRTIERFGARFLDRVFTPTEQALAERRRERVATYAKRWAAKEACSKALGTGLRMGIKWKDMGVVNLATGQPTLEVTGWAEKRLRTLTPAGHRAQVHLTLTDDHPWAMAVVVIEALPET
jgi:holo-[acyl-carrier protein] synthase